MDPQIPLPPKIPQPHRLLAFFAFLLFCSTLFLAYQNIQLQKQIMSFQNTPNSLISPTPNPKANWNTYTDSQNNITFQYPPDWNLHKPTGGNSADPCCNLWFTMGKDRLLEINIFENSYDEAIKKASLIYEKRPEPLTNDKFSGTMFTNDLDGEYILNVNGKALSFHYFLISRDHDNGAAIMAGHILSTFKFNQENNNVSCTYNRKTYQDGESFKDQCNTCSCESGEVMCTLMACE